MRTLGDQGRVGIRWYAARAHGEEVDLEGVPLPRSFFPKGGAQRGMKKIEAIIKPFKLEEVKSGLAELGIQGMTVSEVRGFGLRGTYDQLQTWSGSSRFLPKLKLELIVRNELLGSAVAAIKQCARTGRQGDGKIFVQDLLEVIRIRTEERGDQAI